MINIIKDIEANCPECECSTEETVKFLYAHGDIHFNAEHYREVMTFFTQACDQFGPHKGRRITIEVMQISQYKLKYIRNWVRKVGLT